VGGQKGDSGNTVHHAQAAALLLLASVNINSAGRSSIRGHFLRWIGGDTF
jgi:hypothetical protein